MDERNGREEWTRAKENQKGGKQISNIVKREVSICEEEIWLVGSRKDLGCRLDESGKRPSPNF
jgi:hypothetical protein